jgi:VWFA-related protein
VSRCRHAVYGAVSSVLVVTLSSVRAQAPAQAPTFATSVEAVYVDAVVTQGGRPVRDLAAKDFELRDEGVVRPLELLALESLPLLALLVFDTSGSVAGEKLAALRAAAERFLEIFAPADEVGLLTFSEEVAWRARPTRDRAELRQALADLRARGATSALDGLYAALLLPNAPGRSLVVLFSDGEDNLSWLGEAQVRKVVERSNALVHVVGMSAPPPSVGPMPRRPPAEAASVRVFREIAELTGGRYWPADSPGRLQEAFGALARLLESRVVLRFEPAPGRREGWHRIDLRLRDRPGQVQARRGYWVGKGS